MVAEARRTATGQCRADWGSCWEEVAAILAKRPASAVPLLPGTYVFGLSAEQEREY